MSEFTKEDLGRLAEKGIDLEKVRGQIETFKEGIPFIHLNRAAVHGDGVVRLSSQQKEELRKHYNSHKDEIHTLKFTPASGAASRMFKSLFTFIQEYSPQQTPLESYLNHPDHKALKEFYQGLERFPFYEEIAATLNTDGMNEGQKLWTFVSEMLNEEGRNFGFYPKGLLPFHKYDTQISTPFSEHLREGALYARRGDSARLHFTISPQHSELFQKIEALVAAPLAAETGCEFHISYSFQKESTDTLAVTPENEPFRDAAGQLLFRPGGHGALLENLNEQDVDVVFIKNVDNVVTQRELPEIAEWKEILGGYLLKIQARAFSYARMLADGTVDHDLLKRVQEFLESELNVFIPKGYPGYSLEEQIAVLRDKLDRPLRICGMVRNEGEPGGGPFWITNDMGNESLQIVESAQVDLSDESQAEIFKTATHFNPVDIVCGVRDAYGQKYDLMQYVNSKQGFITEKTYEGRDLKALELPGLWNGGMAFWNTVFVEVPPGTFNPVKTVNDLLKPAHQP